MKIALLVMLAAAVVVFALTLPAIMKTIVDGVKDKRRYKLEMKKLEHEQETLFLTTPVAKDEVEDYLDLDDSRRTRTLESEIEALAEVESK